MTAYGLLELLTTALGIAGLVFGVIFLIYRRILKSDIFPKLTRSQAFILLSMFIVFTFTISFVGMYLALDRNSAQLAHLP